MPIRPKQPPSTPPIDESFLPGEVPFPDVPVTGRGGRLKGEIETPSERHLLARQIAKHEGKKTRPWRESEYIYLGGLPHVYTPHKDLGTIVHLRGGGRILLRDAYVRNLRISGPRFFRVDDIFMTSGVGGVQQVRESLGGAPPGSYKSEKDIALWRS